MQKLLLLWICFYSFYKITAEEQNSTIEIIELQNEVISEKSQFSHLIDLLQPNETEIQEERKNILETQEERPDYQTEEVHQNWNRSENLTAEYKKAFDSVLAKIGKTIHKKKWYNVTRSEMPNMIPIFKTKPQIKPENLNNFDNIASRPKYVKNLDKTNIPNSKFMTKIPDYSDKIKRSDLKAKLNPKSKYSQFIIPCQKASDILDMTIKPQANLNAISRVPKASLPNQNVSLKSVDSDDTAVLLRPKAVSLLQVYGNILKKLTITVLVPYHMSKIKGN